MTERYDGDSEDSRAAFRDYDQRELARTKTTWQIWRDACAWQAARATAEQIVPVAWMYKCWDTIHLHTSQLDHFYSIDNDESYVKGVPLYAAPQPSHNRDSVIEEWIEEPCAAYCIPKPFAIIEAIRALKSQQGAAIESKQAEQSAWQPIETAPKDGRNILIRFGRDGVSQAMYVPGVPHPWKFIDTNDGVTWLINSARDGEYGPSHWMPLPAPPQKPVSDEVKP